jgi:hypothetical protein
VTAHITSAGWRDRRWRPIPEEEARAGRRWGAPTRRFESSLFVDVSDADGELLRRVSYWISLPATRELRAWTKRRGRGPAHAFDPDGGGMDAVRTPPAAEMGRREELREQVWTVGDILRAALAAAAEGYRAATI